MPGLSSVMLRGVMLSGVLCRGVDSEDWRFSGVELLS